MLTYSYNIAVDPVSPQPLVDPVTTAILRLACIVKPGVVSYWYRHVNTEIVAPLLLPLNLLSACAFNKFKSS